MDGLATGSDLEVQRNPCRSQVRDQYVHPNTATTTIEPIGGEGWFLPKVISKASHNLEEVGTTNKIVSRADLDWEAAFSEP